MSAISRAEHEGNDMLNININIISDDFNTNWMATVAHVYLEKKIPQFSISARLFNRK